MSSKRKFINLVYLLCLISAVWHPIAARCSLETNAVSKVSITELLRSKKEWKGKKVEIYGFFVSGVEVRALYENEAESNGTNDHKGLWIDFPTQAAIKTGKVKWVQRGFARVRGTFDFRPGEGCGHLGQWPAKLRDVELVEPGPNPK